MTDAAAIIERLRAATGADRELDANIWRVVEPGISGEHGLDRKPWRYLGNGVWNDDSEPSGHNKVWSPRFTGSLDEALTLFDERPDEISTDPIKVCIAALLARQAAEAASDD